MNSYLTEIESFANNDDFDRVKKQINDLVQSGHVSPIGLDPAIQHLFIEVYETAGGEVWHLALPDQAFRGYLKKIKQRLSVP